MSARGTLLLAASGAAAVACLTGLAAPAGAATPATSPSSAPSAAACDRTAWEATVQGRPKAYHPGAAGGDYLWHDSAGFHLRVTHARTDKAVYTGRIVSSAPMRKDAVRLEGRDTVALSADRKVLSFRFYNYGHTDGVDFHTDCASALTVSWLHRDGAPLSASHVYLGAASAHPARIPFTVHRRPAAT